MLKVRLTKLSELIKINETDDELRVGKDNDVIEGQTTHLPEIGFPFHLMFKMSEQKESEFLQRMTYKSVIDLTELHTSVVGTSEYNQADRVFLFSTENSRYKLEVTDSEFKEPEDYARAIN